LRGLLRPPRIRAALAQKALCFTFSSFFLSSSSCWCWCWCWCWCCGRGRRVLLWNDLILAPFD
jgi:hypothetical protein